MTGHEKYDDRKSGGNDITVMYFQYATNFSIIVFLWSVTVLNLHQPYSLEIRPVIFLNLT